MLFALVSSGFFKETAIRSTEAATLTWQMSNVRLRSPIVSHSRFHLIYIQCLHLNVERSNSLSIWCGRNITLLTIILCLWMLQKYFVLRSNTRGTHSRCFSAIWCLLIKELNQQTSGSTEQIQCVWLVDWLIQKLHASFSRMTSHWHPLFSQIKVQSFSSYFSGVLIGTWAFQLVFGFMNSTALQRSSLRFLCVVRQHSVLSQNTVSLYCFEEFSEALVCFSDSIVKL